MATVGDLVAVDPVRLNRLSGVAEATRREVKARARQWRDKFGPPSPAADKTANGRGRRRGRPDPLRRRSCCCTTRGRPAPRRGAPRPGLMLGLDPGLDPFASQDELAGLLAVTRARVAQQAGALQDGWATPRAATCSTPSRRPPGMRSPTWAASRP